MTASHTTPPVPARPGTGGGPAIGSLCTGYGGLDSAVQAVLGGRLAWGADNDPAAAAVLAHHHPDVPNHGDITAVDWAAVPPVDVLTAGFPCQSVSLAGRRRGLTADAASGLWTHVAAAIDALRPPLVVIENVGGLRSARADSDVEPCPWCLGNPDDEPHLRALGAVLGDLADIGFDACWLTLRASDVGAPHRRERVFVLAWPADASRPRLEGSWLRGRSSIRGLAAAADPAGDGHERNRRPRGRRPGPADGGVTPADAQGDGRDEGRPAPAGHQGGPDVAFGGHAAADAAGHRDPHRQGHDHPAVLLPQPGSGGGDRPGAETARAGGPGGDPEFMAWGRYAAAIARWERVLGRTAPAPTEPGRSGERLSPAFVEWLMGLPEGWVTAVPGLTRNQMLRLLGNGVVPQQGAHALRLLLPELERAAAS